MDCQTLRSQVRLIHSGDQSGRFPRHHSLPPGAVQLLSGKKDGVIGCSGVSGEPSTSSVVVLCGHGCLRAWLHVVVSWAVLAEALKWLLQLLLCVCRQVVLMPNCRHRWMSVLSCQVALVFLQAVLLVLLLLPVGPMLELEAPATREFVVPVCDCCCLTSVHCCL